MHVLNLPETMLLDESMAEAWVFVRVIDNYGDAGVGWRLSCLLAEYLHMHVRLWIDDTDALNKLVPAPEKQARITIEAWQGDAMMQQQLSAAADPVLVIETFGCELPPQVLERMRQRRPLWLNWEYLTAEDWAVGLHAMSSLQPNGLEKYFWFMGIDADSGGLLREPDYLAEREKFRQQPKLQQAFRQEYGLPLQHTGQLWLVFAYTSGQWAQWMAMWQQADTPVTLWLAGGQVIESLRAAKLIAPEELQQEGDICELGNVTLVRIPFVPQAAFDRLLWLADAAIVRGEDSFVRALWAGLPFFWHIYRQDDDVHLQKLHSFWFKAMQGWPAELRQAFTVLSDDLNGAGAVSSLKREQAWQYLCAHWQSWVKSAAAWSEMLHGQDNALEKLARFSHLPLK
ncbi:elongation factor P maturation arginine rhamnosyltransferase EarP [Snodgrassella alvi]|uniref:elongation factor P maturation arginine rhamnosyltransferase EarP n=1 Tax=Snodgrassella alvi TaxID=1196083 RepID=UPI001FD5E186|nr:elongation factor P maturation arginine rhamnosyltransferase EarP [Snodgrassella alvi]WLT04390.1 elongation factor P maturation arginine rhamnosyltransferase EarP [Snodgrassella alvi]